MPPEMSLPAIEGRKSFLSLPATEGWGLLSPFFSLPATDVLVACVSCFSLVLPSCQCVLQGTTEDAFPAEWLGLKRCCEHSNLRSSRSSTDLQASSSSLRTEALLLRPQEDHQGGAQGSGGELVSRKPEWLCGQDRSSCLWS